MAKSIKNIIPHPYDEVKGVRYLDLDDDSNNLNIESSLQSTQDREARPVRRKQTNVERAVKLVDRRITNGDFRERFSPVSTTNTDDDGTGWYDDALAETLQSYTDCLAVAKRLERLMCSSGQTDE